MHQGSDSKGCFFTIPPASARGGRSVGGGGCWCRAAVGRSARPRVFRSWRPLSRCRFEYPSARVLTGPAHWSVAHPGPISQAGRWVTCLPFRSSRTAVSGVGEQERKGWTLRIQGGSEALPFSSVPCLTSTYGVSNFPLQPPPALFVQQLRDLDSY